jgi:hypothetical protein
MFLIAKITDAPDFRINALMYGGARRNRESTITTKTVRS